MDTSDEVMEVMWAVVCVKTVCDISSIEMQRVCIYYMRLASYTVRERQSGNSVLELRC